MDMQCLCRPNETQFCRRGLLFYSVLVTVTVFPTVCYGYELPKCSNGWMMVDETAPHTFICTGSFNNNVSWIVRDTKCSVDVTLGYCEPSTTCYMSFAGVSNMSWWLNSITLTISANQRDTFSGKTLMCKSSSGGANCALNFVVPATFGPCTVGVTVDWTVTGSCQIEKVFSSRDLYSCSWYTSQVNQTVSSDVIPAPVFGKSSFTEFGLQYYRGHCNFTQTFPTQNGVYTYFFQFDPGHTVEINQKLQIEPPGGPPIHTCPLYVAEGSSLVCNCSTTRLGEPPAVLSWGVDCQSNQLRLDNVRRDQNGTEYTCSQTWGRGLQTTKYTLQVAYGPEDKNMSISGPSTFITDGNRTLNLSCQASNTNPTPQYTWTGVTCNEGDSNSTCSFIPRVTGDDGKVVTCTTRNTGMSTDNKTATATYNVTLNYPPSTMVITGYNSSDLLIAGDNVSLTCTVSGGKPPVTDIDFLCKRQDNTRINGTFDPESSSSTVTIDVLHDGDNETRCVCGSKGYWQQDLSHGLEAGVTLTVQAAQSPILKFVTLNNSTSSLIVNATDPNSVTLECSAKGLPRPSIKVVREDTGQELEANFSLSLNRGVIVQHYNLTSSARCQDAAIYTCHASNRAGMDKKNITLLVNCAPQHDNQINHLSIETRRGESKSVTVRITAYPKPLPKVKGVVFISNSSSVNASAEDRQRANVTATCTGTQFIYMYNCTINAINPTTSDAGAYNITFQNSFGDITFSVELSVTLETSTVQAVSGKNSNNAFPVAAVAGGVAGVVGLLLLIAIVVVVFRITRRGKDAGNLIEDRPTRAESEVLEEHVNSMYISSEADLTSPHQAGHAPKRSASTPSRKSLELSPGPHTRNTDEKQDDNEVDDDNNNKDEEETSFDYASVAHGKPIAKTRAFFPVNTDPADLSSDYTYVDIDEEFSKGAASSSGKTLGPANSSMPDLSSDCADAGGYASVDTTRLNHPTASVNGRSSAMHRDSTHLPSTYSNADGYSSVRVSRPDVGGTVKKPGDHVDEYDVVNRTQGWKPAVDRSDEYDHINQQATTVGQDIYAQVDKSSKRKGTAPAQKTDQKPESEPDLYAHVQKPKPATHPKPVVKPKPQQTNDASNAPVHSDNYEDIDGLLKEVTQMVEQGVTQEKGQTVSQEHEQEDEYNVLSHQPASRDQDPQYSHISDT